MPKPRIKLASNGTLRVLNQSYEAAGQGRRTKTWIAPASGPNRALSYPLPTMRNRARAADRNNPWLWKAIESLVANEVGVGVTLRSAAADKPFREQVDPLWRLSRGQLDPEGLLNFGGIQAQAVRTRRVAGEVFIRKRRRRTDSGLAVPVQAQILEPEFVPLGFNRDANAGLYIRDGIEYSPTGQRLAYHMHREHPQDDGRPDFGRLVRVPASAVGSQTLPGPCWGPTPSMPTKTRS